jgi:hypothetical protein
MALNTVELTDADLPKLLGSEGKLLTRYTNIYGYRFYVAVHSNIHINENHFRKEHYVNFYGFYKLNPEFDFNKRQIVMTFGVTQAFMSSNHLQENYCLRQFLEEYGNIEFRKMLNTVNDYNNYDETIILPLDNTLLAPIFKNGKLTLPSLPEDDNRLIELAQKIYCKIILDNKGQHYLRSIDFIDACFVPNRIFNIIDKRLFNDKYVSDKNFGVLTEEGEKVYNKIANRIGLKTITEANLLEIVQQGENGQLEFKSSLRWDFKSLKVNSDLEFAVIKTIAALSNSDGGNLVIGISNNGDLIGLENDYLSFQSTSGNKDKFELHLTQILISAFGSRIASSIAKISFIVIGKNEFCIMTVSEGKEPIFVKKNATDTFYIRMGNSSRELQNPADIAKYCISRFSKPY